MKLSDFTTTVLENRMEARPAIELPRQYLGMSQLNHSCPRYLWYYFRWCFNVYIEKRLQRIYDRGNLEEERVIRDLNVAGCQVTDRQTTLYGFMGHVLGHSDGVVHAIPDAPKTPHLLEIKTMKNSKFNELKKKGMKEANKIYWGQAHTYMGELGLKRAVFIVTNKDTEERYYERVHFDKNLYNDLNDRAMDIIVAEIPPPKIGSADWFECKWCDAKEVCHFGKKHFLSCRTCTKVEIRPEGKWYCTKHKHNLGKFAQMEKCGDYDALAEISS